MSSVAPGQDRAADEVLFEGERRGPLVIHILYRLYKEKPLAFWGGLVPVLVLSLVAIFAGVITDVGPNVQRAGEPLTGPSWDHFFGTDQFGRDVFSRVVHGSRISLLTGVAPVFVGVGIAMVLGVLSGYLGGWVDMLIQRLVDILMAFPTFVFVLLLASIMNPSRESTIISISVILIAGPTRVIRGQVLVVKPAAYVEAARVIGASPARVMLRHIFPNVFSVIIVALSINVGAAILVAASLSFLGLGIPPPTPTWGGMVSGTQLAFLTLQPWIVISAGTALSVTVFAFNMLGDGLRDVLDPRLRGTG